MDTTQTHTKTGDSSPKDGTKLPGTLPVEGDGTKLPGTLPVEGDGTKLPGTLPVEG